MCQPPCLPEFPLPSPGTARHGEAEAMPILRDDQHDVGVCGAEQEPSQLGLSSGYHLGLQLLWRSSQKLSCGGSCQPESSYQPGGLLRTRRLLSTQKLISQGKLGTDLKEDVERLLEATSQVQRSERAYLEVLRTGSKLRILIGYILDGLCYRVYSIWHVVYGSAGRPRVVITGP